MERLCQKRARSVQLFSYSPAACDGNGVVWGIYGPVKVTGNNVIQQKIHTKKFKKQKTD